MTTDPEPSVFAVELSVTTVAVPTGVIIGTGNEVLVPGENVPAGKLTVY
jgi:hypothetical protein